MPAFRPVRQRRPAPEVSETVARGGGLETPMTVDLPGGSLEILLRRSPRARRLRILIDHRRGVVVTVPGPPTASDTRGRPTPVVRRFLAEREPWIRRHLERQSTAAGRAPGPDEIATGARCLYRGEPHTIVIERAPPPARRSTVSREGADDGDRLVIRLAATDRRPPARVLREWLIERARLAVDRAIAAHGVALRVSPSATSIRDPRTRWGSASRTGRVSFSWRLVLAPPEALETVVVHELAHLRVFGHGPDFWALVASVRPDHVAWRRWLRRHAAELHATLE